MMLDSILYCKKIIYVKVALDVWTRENITKVSRIEQNITKLYKLHVLCLATLVYNKNVMLKLLNHPQNLLDIL